MPRKVFFTSPLSIDIEITRSIDTLCGPEYSPLSDHVTWE